MTDHEAVTRFEVIDHTHQARGRVMVRYGVKVDIAIQDKGRTMKVTLTDVEPAPGGEAA